MIICELEFEKPDPKNPDYSLLEVDYYAWIPKNNHIVSHRLSLRKNLKTGKFEVYRFFYTRRIEEVAFEGSFEEALKFADAEYEKWHGKKESDKVCQHRYPYKSLSCKAQKQDN